jgi:hypothetical protein
LRAWLTLTLLVACVEGDGTIDITHDPCAPIDIAIVGADGVQATGVDQAIASWRARGVTAFDRRGEGPAIEIRFEPAALSFHGVYDDELGIVYVNQQIHDLDPLAVVVAHELGHAFGLSHVQRIERISLMNPGNLVTPPTDVDQRALEAMWGACDAPVAQLRQSR